MTLAVAQMLIASKLKNKLLKLNTTKMAKSKAKTFAMSK
jgi:hypothetical protein